MKTALLSLKHVQKPHTLVMNWIFLHIHLKYLLMFVVMFKGICGQVCGIWHPVDQAVNTSVTASYLWFEQVSPLA